MLTHLLVTTTGDVMPVRIMQYEFLFNGTVKKSFPAKEFAYQHAFNRGYAIVEQVGITFTTN
jgi:hypothetical protein